MRWYRVWEGGQGFYMGLVEEEGGGGDGGGVRARGGRRKNG